MAMGAMQQITALGTSTNMQTPNSSESTAAIDDLILHVKNASGASINVTITDPGLTPSGSAASNPVVAIPATTGEKFINIQQTLAAVGTGLVTVAFSATASVTAEWLRM